MLGVFTRVKELSLLLVRHCLEILDHFGAALGQLARRLQVLNSLKVDVVVEDFGADGVLLVGEDASVHEDLVGDLLTLLRTNSLICGCVFYHLPFQVVLDKSL